MNTELLATAIDTLPELPDMDVVLSHLGAIAAIKQFIKEYEPKCKAFVVAEIERTGKPVDQGGGLIWAMTVSSTEKCIDVKCAAEAVYQTALASTGSDDKARERMIDCIAANGLKHGTVERTLDEFGQTELYRGLFETVVKKDVKSNAPVRELSLINTNFTK